MMHLGELVGGSSLLGGGRREPLGQLLLCLLQGGLPLAQRPLAVRQLALRCRLEARLPDTQLRLMVFDLCKPLLQTRCLRA